MGLSRSSKAPKVVPTAMLATFGRSQPDYGR
jgi:hypothetical protein